MTRAPAFSAEDNEMGTEEFKDCFSRFVQNEYAQFEQHHPGSVSSVKHFELPLKGLLNFRVFRVLRFDRHHRRPLVFSFWKRIAGHPPEPSTPKISDHGAAIPRELNRPGSMAVQHITGKVAPCRTSCQCSWMGRQGIRLDYPTA